MPERLNRSASFSYSIIGLAVISVFILGFVAGTRQRQILAVVAPLFGQRVETGTLDLSSVQTTYQLLKEKYDGTLDDQTLIYGANRGLTAAAGDKYTAYMDPKEAKEFNDSLSGKIGGGIGAEIGVREDKPTITRVLADHPAAQAGLLAGDTITSVNDQSTAGWDSDKTARMIRGEVGTTVKVSVLRSKETKTFTITRKEIRDPSVYSEVKNGVGILTITRFDQETAALARKAAESFRQQNVHGVVVDLRGDGGGYLDAAQSVASLWIDGKKLITEQRRNGVSIQRVLSDNDAPLASIKTVILINGGTASASEIVSGALQDYKKATLVGEKSFGKGSVQEPLALDDGSILKITVARWYTPNGVNVGDKGIVPDKEVKRTNDDVNANRDPQLDAALQIM
jgi:carboxyl-terminal processing protease